MEEERPHMERDGAVRGIWSGTGPELCPSGPAGRASRHFTAPRGLGWLLVFFFFSLSPFYDSRVAALRRRFRPARVPRCLATIRQAGRASAVAIGVRREWCPPAAERAQCKVGVRESLTGNGDFPKPFVFDRTVSPPGKPRHLSPTSLSGPHYGDRMAESIRLTQFNL